MKVIIKPSKQEVAQEAYKVFREAYDAGAHVFGLATGSTPEDLYALLAASDLDFSDKVSVNLDEYVGLAPDHDQSYHYFMNDRLFSKKPFKASYVPDGLKDEADAISEYEAILETHPVDIQLLGLGHNGHIAFNEPGTPFNSKTHRVKLTQETIDANKRFFESVDDVPKEAYSMGVESIMRARQILLLATGEGKAQAVQAMIEGPVTEDLPASILQEHDNVTVILDEDAASLLKK